MPTAYFPNPSFLYLLAVAVILGGFLSVAAWIDWKTWKIPKPVSMGMLGTGVVMNLIGGAWMGAVGRPGWLFEGSVGLGILDGLLFSVAGILTGFATFFVLWILSMGGGGDVKLAAALGAWMGPKCFFGVLIMTFPVVLVIIVFQMVQGLLTKGKLGQAPPAGAGKPGKNRLLSFSLPLAIATLIFFVLMFRIDLGITTK